MSLLTIIPKRILKVSSKSWSFCRNWLWCRWVLSFILDLWFDSQSPMLPSLRRVPCPVINLPCYHLNSKLLFSHVTGLECVKDISWTISETPWNEAASITIILSSSHLLLPINEIVLVPDELNIPPIILNTTLSCFYDGFEFINFPFQLIFKRQFKVVESEVLWNFITRS